MIEKGLHYKIQYNNNLYNAIILLKVLMHLGMNIVKIVKHDLNTNKDNDIANVNTSSR